MPESNCTPVSIAIITQDEETTLSRCLKSLSFSEDIVIVDSGSTDKTKEIATTFGTRFYEQKWLGFGPQKQVAIDLCTNDWVLIIDADEKVSTPLAKEILEIVSHATHQAYICRRKNFFNNQHIRYGSWGNDSVVRLINKKKCSMNTRTVHEKIVVEGSIGSLHNAIYHWPRRNIGSFLEKANIYSSLGAIELCASKKNFSLSSAYLHGLWSFFFNYLIRRGFLDGHTGLLIAVSDAIDSFFKYHKAMELQQKNKDN